MGRSYGGYMTMMALTKAPELWAAGVAIVPFVNWFTELQSEDATAAGVGQSHDGRSGDKQGAVGRQVPD